jgi:hypothetical protein
MVVDRGGRYLLWIDGDIGGVGRCPRASQPTQMPRGSGRWDRHPLSLRAQGLAKVIKYPWREILGIGEDLSDLLGPVNGYRAIAD